MKVLGRLRTFFFKEGGIKERSFMKLKRKRQKKGVK